MRILRIINLVCISSTTVVSGWSAGAHKKIALVAFDHLSPKARSDFESLLPRGRTLKDWMVEESTWADTPGRGRDPGGNHFVHITSCRPETMSLQCGDRYADSPQCITTGILRHINGAFSATRNEALLESFKYLIHYMADIHQPLHVALERDLGGNTIQRIAPFKARDRYVNLHEIWDFNLFDLASSKKMFSEGGFPSANSTLLDFTPEHLATREDALRHVESIALETAADVTCGFTYWSTEDEARTFKTMRSETYLTDEYIAQGKLEVVKQVERAGLRLASLLESIFVHRPRKSAAAAPKPVASVRTV